MAESSDEEVGDAVEQLAGKLALWVDEGVRGLGEAVVTESGIELLKKALETLGENGKVAGDATEQAWAWTQIAKGLLTVAPKLDATALIQGLIKTPHICVKILRAWFPELGNNPEVAAIENGVFGGAATGAGIAGAGAAVVATLCLGPIAPVVGIVACAAFLGAGIGAAVGSQKATARPLPPPPPPSKPKPFSELTQEEKKARLRAVAEVLLAEYKKLNEKKPDKV